MAGILLPRWMQQPQQQFVADRSNPLALGLEYLFNAAPSAYPVNLVDGKAASLVSTGLTKINSGVGVGWNVPSSGKSFTMPHKGFGYPLTLFAVVSSPRPTNASGGLFGLNKSGSNSLGIWTDTDYSSMNYARFVTTNTIVGTAGSASRISDKSGKLVVLVSRSSTDHTLYVDGVVAATSAVAGPAIDSTYTLEFLREVDYGAPSLWVYSGTTISMPMAGGYSRALSSAEVYALSRNPWQLFKSPARRVWVPVSSGVAVTLTGQDSTQGNTSSTGAVSQIHVLTGENASQANSSTVGAISQTHVLTGSDVSQVNASDTGAVSQTHILAGQNATQPNLSSTGAISTGATVTLSGQDVTQANASTTGAVSQVHVLGGADVIESILGSTGSVSQIHILSGSSATQTNTSTSGAITQTQTLTGDSVNQPNASTSGAVAIPSGYTLTYIQMVMVTEIWQRLGLDGTHALSESEGSAAVGTITITKTGPTTAIVSTRTGGSAAVVSDVGTMIAEIWQRLGLDPANPMTVTDTSLTFSTVTQSIVDNAGVFEVTRV